MKMLWWYYEGCSKMDLAPSPYFKRTGFTESDPRYEFMRANTSTAVFFEEKTVYNIR